MSAKSKKDKPDASEVQALRAHLVAAGVPANDAAALVKVTRTRGENAVEIISWVRGRPGKVKGKGEA